MGENFLVRLILLPFSLLYGLVISLNELLYRLGILKSVQFNLPVIGIGNLSVGGTGKTPHAEYLVRWLNQYLQVATLSRGYGRSTVGLREVQRHENADLVGDEPLLIKRKHPDVPVFVAESRALGIPAIVQRYPSMQAIILDDAHQHRAIKPGRQILLTEYARPYTRDWLLPAGRLREWRSGALRADTIVVTKCPVGLTEQERTAMIAEIDPAPHQKVYFSTYQYGKPYHLFVPGQTLNLDTTVDVLLVTAIAKTDVLEQYVASVAGQVRSLSFKDHHNFEPRDFETIRRDFSYLNSQNKVVLCTEKDAVKLERFAQQFAQAGIEVFVLPVEVQFLGEDAGKFQEDIRSWLLNFKH